MKYKSVYKAAQEMALANKQTFHIAAILWRRNTPINIGVNTSQTHPAFKDYRKETRHAEICVLTQSRPGDTIEILRWTADGQPVPIDPCSVCAAHIKKRGVNVKTPLVYL